MKLLNIYLLIFVFSSINIKAQIQGCTDPLAVNYNSSATLNDGSCTYNNSNVVPIESHNLSNILNETSGLIHWNDKIWTHNDSSDINIYSLNATNGAIIQTYPLTGTINTDWEEISQDNDFIYIGDFGNNASGNRTNLKILKIEKNSLLINNPIIETINFSYSDQINFNPVNSNTTDFDCEAFIVSANNIYLFSKQWTSNKTSVYSLPKNPGTYSANLIETFNIEGLVTGAVYLETERLVVLCGYSNSLQPFIYLLYDFNGANFFNGNKRKINISLPFHQIEGISSSNGLTYAISNENFSLPPFINVPQKIHFFDLSSFLNNYFSNLNTIEQPSNNMRSLYFHPNPVVDIITIKSENLPQRYKLTNSLGQTVSSGILTTSNSSFNMENMPKGLYFLKFEKDNNVILKVIKK